LLRLQIYTKSFKFRKYYDFFGIDSEKIDIFTDFRDVGKAFQNLHFSENQKRQAITLRVLKHELPSICHEIED